MEQPKYRIQPVKWRKKAGGGKQPYQGHFYPGNPEKYEGNVNTIVFRSGLELRLFKYMDEAPGIIRWSSEEIVIPYRSIDGKWHRYFVDVKLTTKKEEVETTYLIEVKPACQCKPPTLPKKPNKKSQARFLRESNTFRVNQAKWAYAEAVCQSKGWIFLKITEKDLMFGR
jgi:hypothetical protein